MTIRDVDYFMDMIDEIIDDSLKKENTELFAQVSYIHRRAEKLRISFYEMVFRILGEVQVNKRLTEWKKHKGLIQ